MLEDYKAFLQSKRIKSIPQGFDIDPDDLHDSLFDFQRFTVQRSLKLGKSAQFAQTGMGKTLMQLSFAQEVSDRHDSVLIFAPLSVARQTAASESSKFGIDVNLCESEGDLKPGINITNYEKIHKFTAGKLAGIVCDEASILKDPDGFTSQALIDFASKVPYRLACTATPAANDFDEFGTIAEFLGIMTKSEMLATFFTHDGGDTSSWILMGHGEKSFWEWVCSWATAFKHPADLGFDGSAYEPAPIVDYIHLVDTNLSATDGQLLYDVRNMNDRRRARRACTNERVAEIADVANQSPDNWLIFCDYIDEGDLLEKAIADSVQVQGKDRLEKKVKAAIDFAEGRIKNLIVKKSMFGAGMNFQYHCNNVAFVGIDDSWEKFHQCSSRVHRYGQQKQVNRRVAFSYPEQCVWDNLQRKREQDSTMWQQFQRCMIDAIALDSGASDRHQVDYNPQQEIIVPDWLKGVEAA